MSELSAGTDLGMGTGLELGRRIKVRYEARTGHEHGVGIWHEHEAGYEVLSRRNLIAWHRTRLRHPIAWNKQQCLPALRTHFIILTKGTVQRNRRS